MRGSPLLRSIFIVLLLVASATVLTHLTAARSPAGSAPATKPVVTEAGRAEIPYRLQLSAEAAEVKIAMDGQPPSASLAGTLVVSSEHPVVSLTVRWKQPPAPDERRFAKLTLEPAGKSTITHVFDASGDIDDILELP